MLDHEHGHQDAEAVVVFARLDREAPLMLCACCACGVQRNSAEGQAGKYMKASHLRAAA